jgi:hypothetical protein
MNWQSKISATRDLLSETTAYALEKKRAVKLNLSTDEITLRINKQLALITAQIDTHEESLSETESRRGLPVAQLKQWEDELLAISKQYERLVKMIDPQSDTRSSNRKLLVPDIENQDLASADLNNNELLQLQNNIMADQDKQLDQLSSVISRQKEIGIAIGNELELQVDLLEDTDQRIENTRYRMRTADRNLGTLFDKDDTKGICF